MLLARRRWEKITAAQLEEAFALIRTGLSWHGRPAPPSGAGRRQHQGAPNALPAAEQPGEGTRTPPILRPGKRTHTHALVQTSIR
jgi:hypothetical protein